MNTEVKEKTQIEKIDKSNIDYKYAYNSKNKKFTWLGNCLETEAAIFKNEANKKINNKPNFKRGEIIKVDFGINMGSELCNIHFAIVLNSDDNNSVDNITVLPLTSKPGYKRLYLGDLLKAFKSDSRYNKRSYALLTQITTISKNKIFDDDIRFCCNKDTLNIINTEIINFLTK